jgi:N-methylhydantoinase B
MGISAQTVLNKDDVVRMVTCSGGGYGDPKKRNPEKVRMDVKNGYISPAQAAEDYGVLVDPGSFAIQEVRRRPC